jgi:LPS export ABC transporter protein LptC
MMFTLTQPAHRLRPFRGATAPGLRRLAIRALAALLVTVCAVSALPLAAQEEPVLEIEGMTYVASQGAENELVLEAERARYRAGRSLVHLEGVQARVAPGAGQPGFEMTCAQADFDLGRSDFQARGQVRGRTRDGREIATDRLSYRHDEGLVSTDDPVVIRDVTGTYRGGGFRYRVKDGSFQLVGGASVEQQP